MTHDLKIHPKHYWDVFNGTKRAEIRLNDRQYKYGDFLRLRAFDGDKNQYIDVAPLLCFVSHILPMHDGLKANYVILSIVPLNNSDLSIDYSNYGSNPIQKGT